jgi:acylphosphatase
MRGRAHVEVSGRVQGVSFRYFTRQKALSLGLRGWVRNLPNGRVECEFEGPTQAIEEMIEFCREGPKWAKVTSVDVKWLGCTGQHSSFQIRV